MADNFQEKTEQPTPKRLEEARQKGNVAKSMEVNSALVLIGGAALLYFMGNWFFRQLAAIFRGILGGGYMTEINNAGIQYWFVQGLLSIGLLTLIFMVGVMAVGLSSNIAQVGFLFSVEALQPRPEKINPFKGLKKVMFSQRSLEELVKNILKLTVVLIIGYYALMGYQDRFLPLADQQTNQIAVFMAGAALNITFKISLALLILSLADYAFQRYDYKSNLKMTKQEIKDETKQSEGDPKIKSKIRSMQIQMSRNRMMHEAAHADVVITNPTHYAVALKYEASKMAAPRVVAKGKNYIALRIRKIAEENHIPIMEDPPLARALYQAVELNQEVPARFFQALAEVLAYVYKMKNKKLS